MVKVVRKTTTALQKIVLLMIFLPLALFVLIGKAILRAGGIEKSHHAHPFIDVAEADVGGNSGNSGNTGDECSSNSNSGTDATGGDCGTGSTGDTGDTGDTGSDE